MIEVDSILDVVKHLNDVDLVIFDLDDTLYSEKSYVKSGYRKIACAYPEIADFEKKLWEAFLKRERAIDVVLENEGKFSSQTKKHCVEIYRNQNPDIKVYDGIFEMLQGIAKAGKKLGLITDGRPEGQRAKIEALGLEPFFDRIVITDELGGIEFRKPCTYAFELMLDFAGVEAGRAVYIGDNLNKDFIAPETLGMKSIFFRNVDGLYYIARGEDNE